MIMTDITTRGEYQNNIDQLVDLEGYDYENIFKLCVDTDKSAYFYNLLKAVNIPTKIEQDLFYTHQVSASQPLTALSHSIYGNMKLWWLICVVNQISNPVKFIPPGKVLKVIKPRHVPYIVDLIKQNLID